MSLSTFLAQIKNNHLVGFAETIAMIEAHYNYQPTEFSNGVGDDRLMSPAGTNEGSCKIFAFAQLHDLTIEQTLNLFGDYYRLDVLQNPNGTDHQNIRLFIKYGWRGVSFQNSSLTAK
jgi:hypothetical protein